MSNDMIAKVYHFEDIGQVVALKDTDHLDRPSVCFKFFYEDDIASVNASFSHPDDDKAYEYRCTYFNSLTEESVQEVVSGVLKDLDENQQQLEKMVEVAKEPLDYDNRLF